MRYQKAELRSIYAVFSPLVMQSGQFALACSSDPDCAAAREGGFDVCCQDGANARFSEKLVTDFGCEDFLPECDFQTDTSTNFSCSSVSVVPLGECEGNCVFLVTCEDFSGDCPDEGHFQLVCTDFHGK